MRPPFSVDRPYVPAYDAQDPLLRALLAPPPPDAKHCEALRTCPGLRDRRELRLCVQHVRTRTADGPVRVVSRMRTPDALEAILTDIARRFAEGVLEAVCAGSLAELVEAAATPRVRSTPSPPVAERAERVGAASAGRRASRRSPRGSATTGNVAAVVAAIRAAGHAGIVAEKLRTAVGLSRPSFLYAMGRALEAHAVRKTGRLRGTRYFAP
jgi:hypothetical protein